jgi:hypothetical protein
MTELDKWYPTTNLFGIAEDDLVPVDQVEDEEPPEQI